MICDKCGCEHELRTPSGETVFYVKIFQERKGRSDSWTEEVTLCGWCAFAELMNEGFNTVEFSP